MDRIGRMRQADWARLFGFACVAVGMALSAWSYPGADWDALILFLGALMLLRAAVEAPSANRVTGLERALRVILFMFAFAAVNRAQTDLAGAVAGALGNWILWAVAALLLALPLLRRGLPWGAARPVLGAVALLAGVAVLSAALFWALGSATAGLRTLVTVAAVANALPVWRVARPDVAAVSVAVALCCVVVAPGAPLWPVALAVLPIGALAYALRRRALPR
ncbi:hypothetical protein [Paragemmobacter ruber]|uniref:Uncharacterized protein n=1 Tax=Paragemmobacter ruber TaxID=1985673 RepID=A0ABW9Y2Y8_9RHOB|nr:hypothetical protein [Rhodobacter ruber]NBE06777.1 hypothetical protein [Rhodobacter ruber]